MNAGTNGRTNGNRALLAALSPRYLLIPALLGACSTGCSLVIDAEELAQGYDEGVEIVASQQCNPIRLAVTDDHVYWATAFMKTVDEACAGPESTTIRRLALGSTDEPQNIVTNNLDGEKGELHPWGLTVAGEELYWVTDTEIVCTAAVGNVNQACSPATLLKPCKSYGIASADGLVYYHGGDCEGGTGTGIWSYAPGNTPSDLGIAVSGSFVVWMGVAPVAGSPKDTWLAWIDKCPSSTNNRINVTSLPAATVIWQRCTNSTNVRTGAIDEGGLYWVDELATAGTAFMLPLPNGVLADAEPTPIVTGLTSPNGIALDAERIYITSEAFGGSVLHLKKGEEPLDEEQLGVVASDRKGAHGGKGSPYRIAADNQDWLYWVVNDGGHAVERARKPR